MTDRHGVVYRAKDGWRWKLVSDRGNLPDELVAESGEAYEGKGDCLAMFADLHPKVPVEFKDET